MSKWKARALGMIIIGLCVVCYAIYKKYTAYIRNKSKINSYVSDGRIYEIKATTGQRYKVKYYYYDHISQQETHTGEFIMSGSKAGMNFVMTSKMLGEDADAPIQVFYDPNNPDNSFTDQEIGEIKKTANEALGIGLFCLIGGFILYSINLY